MNTVKVDLKSDDKASRVELIVRWVWAIITCIVLFFFAIIALICFALQWLFILFTGKRNATLTGWLKKYCVYHAQASAYQLLITDERNPLIPE